MGLGLTNSKNDRLEDSMYTINYFYNLQVVDVYYGNKGVYQNIPYQLGFRVVITSEVVSDWRLL